MDGWLTGRGALLLQNQYEKEIKANLEFKSAYIPDDIELVPEEQFLAQMPEERRQALQGPDKAHELMLERLKLEKQQRLDVLREKEELKARKAGPPLF